MALLVDLDVWKPEEASTETLLDEFVARSHGIWEGRATPLILHRGGTIAEEDWRFLRLSDPDCIQSAGPLANDMLSRIDDELAPIHVDLARVCQHRASFEPIGIPIFPTEEVLAAFGKLPILVFDLKPGCDPQVRRFVERNFGAFEQWVDTRNPEAIRRMAPVEGRLKHIPIEAVPISDRASLADFLNFAAGSRPAKGVAYVPPRRFVALCELAGHPTPHSFLRGNLDREYLVHVGDSASDFAVHWNTSCWSGNLAAPYRNQLWIPMALAQDASLNDALNNWLRVQTGAGNSNPRGVVFASMSIESDLLRACAEAICRSSKHPVPFRAVTKEESTKTREHSFRDLDHRVRLIGSESDVYRRIIHGTRGVVDIPFPTPCGITKPEGTWMVDVQVEQIAPGLGERDPIRPWLLPRSASRMAQQIFRAAARINHSGIFSVEMTYNTVFIGNRAKPELRLQLVDEANVVSWLLTSPRSNWRMPKDPRTKLPGNSTESWEVRFSQPGRLLRGLLGLFGGLSDAEQFLSRPFWQKLFRELAAIDPKRDQELIDRTRNLLKKKLKQLKPTSVQLEEAAKGIAGLVGGRAHGQYRTLRQCERLRLDLGKSEQQQGQFAAGSTRTIVIRMGPFSREQMLGEFNVLTSRGILRLGAALACPRCGVTTWHGLPSLKETVNCPGCDFEITVPINQQWSVELNSLAKMAVVQGVLGVVQAACGLGQMAESFFYMPSCELFRPGDKDPWHEVDLAAVVNGELVVCEVKEGGVKPKDLDSLVEISEVLRPARAVLFVNKEEWSSEMNRPFEKAKEQLAL